MDVLAFERRHASGVRARVYRESEGAGYRPATLPPVEDREEPEWPYLDTIDEAQASADAVAHPGCAGEGCGSWTAQVSRPLE